MGMFSTPATAVTASVITWYSFFQNATQSLRETEDGGDREVLDLPAVIAEAGAHAVFLQELRIAFEERDLRIRELETVAGAAERPSPLSDWRRSLGVLALSSSTASAAGAPYQEGSNYTVDVDALSAPKDALGALLEAHVGIATLLRDSAQDTANWAAEQIWSWPPDSSSSLVSMQGAPVGAYIGQGLAEAIAHVNVSLPAGVQAALSAGYTALQAPLSKLVRSVAERHPQHAATLARDPVLLAVQLAVFVLLACWELYGLLRVLLALARRVFRAACCSRRLAACAQRAAAPKKGAATGRRAEGVASPRLERVAAGSAVAAALTPPRRSKGGLGNESASRSPLHVLQECDKENRGESPQCYM